MNELTDQEKYIDELKTDIKELNVQLSIRLTEFKDFCEKQVWESCQISSESVKLWSHHLSIGDTISIDGFNFSPRSDSLSSFTISINDDRPIDANLKMVLSIFGKEVSDTLQEFKTNISRLRNEIQESSKLLSESVSENVSSDVWNEKENIVQRFCNLLKRPKN